MAPCPVSSRCQARRDSESKGGAGRIAPADCAKAPAGANVISIATAAAVRACANLPRMRARAVCGACVLTLGCGGWSPAFAQQHGLSVAAKVLFYGDNTEFRNSFREGETLFGAAARGEVRIDLGGGVSLA